MSEFNIEELEQQVRETLADCGIDYDALPFKSDFSSAQQPAPVLGGSGAGLVTASFPSFDRVYAVRAFYYRAGLGHRPFERFFPSLPQAEKFRMWMLANTDHSDVRIEDDLGQVVTFIGKKSGGSK
jgi:hypothetical protein